MRVGERLNKLHESILARSHADVLVNKIIQLLTPSTNKYRVFADSEKAEKHGDSVLRQDFQDRYNIT